MRPDVAELSLVPSDNNKSKADGRSGDHRVRKVVIKRLANPSLAGHDPGACQRILNCPSEDASSEDVLEQAAKPEFKSCPSATGTELADSIEDFPSRY